MAIWLHGSVPHRFIQKCIASAIRREIAADPMKCDRLYCHLLPGKFYFRTPLNLVGIIPTCGKGQRAFIRLYPSCRIFMNNYNYLRHFLGADHKHACTAAANETRPVIGRVLARSAASANLQNGLTRLR